VEEEVVFCVSLFTAGKGSQPGSQKQGLIIALSSDWHQEGQMSCAPAGWQAISFSSPRGKRSATLMKKMSEWFPSAGADGDSARQNAKRSLCCAGN
jgi:hypothetical protein